MEVVDAPNVVKLKSKKFGTYISVKPNEKVNQGQGGKHCILKFYRNGGDGADGGVDGVSHLRWKECKAKSLVGSLESCKEAMESVKDEFFKTLKDKFGFSDKAIKDMLYLFSGKGICLIFCPPVLNGYNYFTGLVQIQEAILSGATESGGLWASIRVRVPVGLPKEKNQLQGFIVSISPNLNFVQDKQYSGLPWWHFPGSFGGQRPEAITNDESKNDGINNNNSKLAVSLKPPPFVYPKNWQPLKKKWFT